MKKTVCDAVTGTQHWAIHNNMSRDHIAALLGHEMAFTSFWGDYEEPDILDVTYSGNVAVVKVHGTILHGVGYYRWAKVVDVQLLEATVRKLGAATNINKIILDVESPGGVVAGVSECAEAIHEVSKKKKIIAFSSGMMCSAAYWLAAACSEIVVTKTSEIGSIGVRIRHIEYSKLDEEAGVKITEIGSGEWKTFGSDSRPLTDKEIEKFQSIVDDLADMFFEAIAGYRSMDVKTIKAMEADVFFGEKAVENGLADRVGVLDNLKSEKNSGYSAKTKSKTFTRNNPMEKFLNSLSVLCPDLEEVVARSIASNAQQHFTTGHDKAMESAGKEANEKLAAAVEAKETAEAKTTALEATVSELNKQVVASTWEGALAGTLVPEALHDDLKASVSADTFTKEGKLDSAAFATAAKEKLTAWSKNFTKAGSKEANTPNVAGAGGGFSQAGEEDADEEDGYSLDSIKALKE